jgi:hypothetical protein
MSQIEIAIENAELRDLGISQDDEYTTFIFRPDKLSGWWIARNDEDKSSDIIFYVDGNKFCCDYDEENFNILNSILPK